MTTILSRIGNTSLLPLTRLPPPGCARISVKVESENPTGSMKDRMALAIIDAAQSDGRLPPGGAVVEYTGGSTGVSLALVCAVRGYRLDIVTADAFAPEKLDHMRLLGATLHVLKSEAGRMTEKLTRDMIDRADMLRQERRAFWPDQMRNRDQLGAYVRMAEEILDQTGGRIDAFVQSVGTAASFIGMGGYMRQHLPAIRLVAVEPAESAVLAGGTTGAHGIDGIGAGYVVPLWEPALADAIEPVSTQEARAMALRLACEEGLFAGLSSGANVVAALRLARELGPGAHVVTVLCDTGMKYLRQLANHAF